MPFVLERERHPALPWAWAGSVLLLLISKRSHHEIVICLAVIAASFVLYFTTDIPRHRQKTFRLGCSVAIIAVAIRMIVAVIIGVPMPGRVLFRIPQLELPNFMVGIRIGGPVTSERMISALTESLLFAAIIIAISLANVWTSPHRLLKILPYRFYGFGLASSIANSITPQAAASISRVHQALRLRGDESSKVKKVRRILMPVLEESLERSIDLAAALEVRGYGRTQTTKYRPERWTFLDSLPIIGILLLIATLPLLNASALIEFVIVFGVLMTARLS